MLTTRPPRWATIAAATGAAVLGAATAFVVTLGAGEHTPSGEPGRLPLSQGQLAGSVIETAAPTPAAAAPEPASDAVRPAPPAPDVQAGQTLDGAPTQLPTGLLAHRLADGRFLVVDPAAPASQELVSDLRSQLPVLAAPGSTVEELVQTRTRMEEFAAATHASTGKWIAAVVAASGSTSADEVADREGWQFIAQGDRISVAGLIVDKDAALAEAQQWLSQQPNPDEYVLLAP